MENDKYLLVFSLCKLMNVFSLYLASVYDLYTK